MDNMMVLKGILQNNIGGSGFIMHLAQDRNKVLDFVDTITNCLVL
jgi:hypothetical protein